MNLNNRSTVMMRTIIIMMVICGLHGADIYAFIDGKSDGSDWRTLVTVDNVPWLFVIKTDNTETIVTKDECRKYDFTVKVDAHIMRGISYASGVGCIAFSNNGTHVEFSDEITKVSWSHSATGVGPWPVSYVIRLNDIRLMPRNSVESKYISDNYHKLLQENLIKDNRK